MIGEAAIPRFSRGSRLRFDAVREAWIVLAPERMFQPDEHALEVLKLVDGHRSFGVIIDDLCARFAAPREVVSVDVAAMLEGLAEKGVLVL